MARQSLLRSGVGERLLASKLQILNGLGSRRPSLALRILTGGGLAEPRPTLVAEPRPTLVAEPRPALVAPPLPVAPKAVEAPPPGRPKRQFSPRTVYLADRHLRDIDRIIAVWEQAEARPLNRSAVVRRAIAHLRTLVEAEKD